MFQNCTDQPSEKQYVSRRTDTRYPLGSLGHGFPSRFKRSAEVSILTVTEGLREQEKNKRREHTIQDDVGSVGCTQKHRIAQADGDGGQ
jgi:hypothetical protein